MKGCLEKNLMKKPAAARKKTYAIERHFTPECLSGIKKELGKLVNETYSSWAKERKFQISQACSKREELAKEEGIWGYIYQQSVTDQNENDWALYMKESEAKKQETCAKAERAYEYWLQIFNERI